MNNTKEIEVREQLKMDRRKLFKTLYTLPWILIITGMLITGYYWGKQEREAGRREVQLLANSNGIGKWVLEEDKIVFKFNTISNRLVDFEESELKSLVSVVAKNEINKINEINEINEINLEPIKIYKELYLTNIIVQTNVIQLFTTNYETRIITITNMVTNSISDFITNSYKYSYRDKMIGDKAGIDIEKLIRERTYIRVREIFTQYNVETGIKLEGLEARLLIGIREEIRGSFEIFEVYNKAIK